MRRMQLLAGKRRGCFQAAGKPTLELCGLPTALAASSAAEMGELGIPAEPLGEECRSSDAGGSKPA
jgi:hypothetical protein